MAEDKKTTPEKKESKKTPEEKKANIETKGKAQQEKPNVETVVNGRDIPISKLEAMAICNFIRGKDVDKAIAQLEEVTKLKRAIPMRGEIPHRKGNMMSGRYPIKASGEIIKLLKSLRSNAIANQIEFEKYAIFCKANKASRPFQRFGRTRYKRTHVTLKLIPMKIKETMK
jgi:ribosomal protein L22